MASDQVWRSLYTKNQGSAFFWHGSRPWSMLVFYWVYKVFLTYSPVPHWGAVAGSFPERGNFRCFASFSIGFDDFWLTVLGSTFFLTRRAAPLENVGFLLVFTRFSLCIRLCPTGWAVAGPFPERGHFRCFASFSNGFDDFWSTMFVCLFFWHPGNAGNAWISTVSEGFQASAFFWH